jgi:hypothetical protein
MSDSGGAAEAGGSASTPIEPQSLTGRIVAPRGAVAGAIVIVNGIQAVTDSGGLFTISDAPSPYDITVLSKRDKVVQVVDGLSTRSPIIMLRRRQLNRYGSFEGQLGEPLIPNKEYATFAFSSPEIPGGGATANANAEGTLYGAATVEWEDAPATTGELLAMRWEENNQGEIGSYTGFAKANITLTDRHFTQGPEISFANDPPEKVVEVTLVGDDSIDYFGYLHVGSLQLPIGNRYIPLPLKPGVIKIVVPQVDLPIGIRFGGGRSVPLPFGVISEGFAPLPASGTAEITVPESHHITSPSQLDSPVTLTTKFEWAGAPAHMVARVRWIFGDWWIDHVTKASSVTLPDLSSTGFVYPHVQYLGCAVEGVGPADTIEEGLKQYDVTWDRSASYWTTYASTRLTFPE